MKIERLDKNIIYYKELINDIDFFISLIEDTKNDINFLSDWKSWYASDSNVMYGKSREGSFSSILNNYNKNNNSFYITKKIKDIIDNCLDHYCKETNQDPGYLPDHFTIKKYNTESYMGPHVDTEDLNDKKQPSLSMVFYLNNNYEGGQIEFPKQDISIKPEAGSLIIFPSYQPYLHDPKPVLSGYKYMVPLFSFKEKFWEN